MIKCIVHSRQIVMLTITWAYSQSSLLGRRWAHYSGFSYGRSKRRTDTNIQGSAFLSAAAMERFPVSLKKLSFDAKVIQIAFF